MSRAITASNPQAFEESTYALRRTTLMGVLDHFIAPTKKLIEEDFLHTNYFNQDPLQMKRSSALVVDLKREDFEELLDSESALQPHDDNDLSFEPKNRVDYFSYDWTDREILKLWRYVVDRKKSMDGVETSRLENASWRTWARAKYGLKTVTPESINWKKDIDVSWLYGPKCAPETESDVRTRSYKAIKENIDDAHSSNADAPKPILKLRKISEKIKAHAEMLELCMNKHPAALKSSFATLPKAKGQPRSIHFNDRVEQCRIVDYYSELGELDELLDSSLTSSLSSSLSSGVFLNIRPSGRPFEKRNMPKIIERLPSTKIRFKSEEASDELELELEDEAMLHNVNSRRGYEFYDYNTVYMPEDIVEDVPSEFAVEGLEEEGQGFILTGDEALSLSSEETMSFGGRKDEPELTKKPSSNGNLSSYGNLTMLSRAGSLANLGQGQGAGFLVGSESDSDSEEDGYFTFGKPRDKGVFSGLGEAPRGHISPLTSCEHVEVAGLIDSLHENIKPGLARSLSREER